MLKKEIATRISCIRELLDIVISDEMLIIILFEMARYFDKIFVKEIQSFQQQKSRIFNQNERNLLRKYYYYQIEEILGKLSIEDFSKISYTDEDVLAVLADFTSRLEKYEPKKIINSIIRRKQNLESGTTVDNSHAWLEYYRNKVVEKYKFSSFILTVTQEDFRENNYLLDNYYKVISSIYNKLENYRNLFIVIKGEILDENRLEQTWKIIYKLGIYCENFVRYNEKFHPFKKDKSIEKLIKFLDERFPENDNEIFAERFYSSISTGLKYEDCFVSDNQETIILSYKKIALDNTPIPCPSCMTTIQQGNSYPELFLRSYECKNPNCPDRSKSGRGKRFDEFGIYRYSKLIEDDESNRISYELYDKWRRDIFDGNNDIFEMLIKYYTWGGETICVYPNVNITEPHGRIIKLWDEQYCESDNHYRNYDSLPIVILMKSIKSLFNHNTGNHILTDRINIINDDSTIGIRTLNPHQVANAITSPPYYNAREYSQWPTLIMYLIDMMINCSSVYDTLQDNGHYLYNIGDIVSPDNVYVESTMSKRRLQLGFLSCMFFEIVGYNLIGNIIWDKGQVQSKRNSTINLNSGYVKSINCYEHVLIFKKGNAVQGEKISRITRFSPVIKINSKGVNTFKHTAPYPLEMVDLLRPFINDTNQYILDPFLGSGTTMLWCKQNNYKGVGFEMNQEYYELCNARVFEKGPYYKNISERLEKLISEEYAKVQE